MQSELQIQTVIFPGIRSIGWETENPARRLMTDRMLGLLQVELEATTDRRFHKLTDLGTVVFTHADGITTPPTMQDAHQRLVQLGEEPKQAGTVKICLVPGVGGSNWAYRWERESVGLAVVTPQTALRKPDASAFLQRASVYWAWHETLHMLGLPHPGEEPRNPVHVEVTATAYSSHKFRHRSYTGVGLYPHEIKHIQALPELEKVEEPTMSEPSLFDSIQWASEPVFWGGLNWRVPTSTLPIYEGEDLTRLHAPVYDVRQIFPDESSEWTTAKLKNAFTVHHDAVVFDEVVEPGQSLIDSLDRLRVIHNYHLNKNGVRNVPGEPPKSSWNGIGYHALVDPIGRIFLVGELNQHRAHVSGYSGVDNAPWNHVLYGICILGNYADARDQQNKPVTALADRPTVESLRSLDALCRHITNLTQREFGLRPHKYYQNKACPGTWVDTNAWENFKYEPQPQQQPEDPELARLREALVQATEGSRRYQAQLATANGRVAAYRSAVTRIDEVLADVRGIDP